MERPYLVKYKNQEGTTSYKLVDEKAFIPKGKPIFEIEGISIFDILYIHPYL
tara:strand:+ start:1049 stop:1204 length:156 start_codon:yes stop_codon:yes gene_type:complete